RYRADGCHEWCWAPRYRLKDRPRPLALSRLAIARDDTPAAYSSKMRRTVAASCTLILRSPVSGRPSRAETAHHVIAVAVATTGLAGFDPAAEATASLVGEILEIERSHRPFQADMELVDVTLRAGDDPAARTADPL